MSGRGVRRIRRVVILGAGISGLAAAWRLVEKGASVDVVEAAPAVGGLAGTHTEDGYSLDIGPHSLYSDDHDVLRTLLGLFTPALPPRRRSAKLFYEGRLVDYPLTTRSVLLQMGLRSGIRGAASAARSRILRSRRRPDPGAEPSVESWAIEHFGEHLYRSFFKPYTEQFWRIPCDELAPEAIPTHTRMSFAATLRGLLRRRGSLRGSLIEREALPMYCPEPSFAEIPRRIAAHVVRAGGRIHLGRVAAALEPRAGGEVRVSLRRGEVEESLAADHVISTVPVPVLVDLLGPAAPREVRTAAANLDYRALLVLGMVTRRQGILGCSYLYQLGRPYNRVFEANAFSSRSAPPGENILAVEIPCQRASALWHASADDLYASCIPSLSADRILAPADVTRLLLVRAPYAYPIYRRGWKDHLGLVRNHVEGLGYLSLLGRSGEFRYMDADRCVRRAFDAVDAGPWGGTS